MKSHLLGTCIFSLATFSWGLFSVFPAEWNIFASKQSFHLNHFWNFKLHVKERNKDSLTQNWFYYTRNRCSFKDCGHWGRPPGKDWHLGPPFVSPFGIVSVDLTSCSVPVVFGMKWMTNLTFSSMILFLLHILFYFVIPWVF